MEFSFSHEGRNDGPMNMQRDSDLLTRAEAGVVGCRVYQWSGPWVSLGCFQSPERALVSGTEVPWVLRPTGGKAVLHGHDMTVGMACPLASLEIQPKDVKGAYRALAYRLITALRAARMNVTLGEETRFHNEGPKTADCFTHVSSNDIVDPNTGAKLCGCALKITDKAVLLQASIPFEEPLVDPQRVLVGGSAQNPPKWETSKFPQLLFETLESSWPLFL